MPTVTTQISRLKQIDVASLGAKFALALVDNDRQKILEASYQLKMYCLQYKFTQEALDFLQGSLEDCNSAFQLTGYYLKIIYNLYLGEQSVQRTAQKLEKYTKKMNAYLSCYPTIADLEDAIQAECWLLWHKNYDNAGIFLHKMYQKNNRVEARYLAEVYQYKALLTQSPEPRPMATHPGYLMLQALRKPMEQNFLLEQALQLGDLRAVAQLAVNHPSLLNKRLLQNFVAERMREEFWNHPTALNITKPEAPIVRSAFRPITPT